MTATGTQETRLPRLMDCRAIMDELGVKRGAAEALMQDLPKHRIGRRVFVEQSELLDLLEQRKQTAAGFPLRQAS